MLIQSPTRIYRSWAADSRRWNNYCPRVGDIVIATYPKSGTTWMQQIVSLLIFQSPEPRPVAEIAPWFDRRELEDTPEAIMQRLDTQTHRRFIKSHVPFDGMPIYDEVKYIHVARDGRDACLSYHNHCLAFNERNLARFDKFGLTDETLGRPYPRAPKDPREFFLRWMNEGVNGSGEPGAGVRGLAASWPPWVTRITHPLGDNRVSADGGSCPEHWRRGVGASGRPSPLREPGPSRDVPNCPALPSFFVCTSRQRTWTVKDPRRWGRSRSFERFALCGWPIEPE